MGQRQLGHLAITLISYAILVSGCAKPPERIAPFPVPMGDFANLTCKQLHKELDLNLSKLADAEASQKDAVTADAVGVLVFLIPPSLFLGDASDDVAVAKGRQIALTQAIDHRCS